MISKNIGTLDRTLRLAAGAAILVWGWTQQNWLGLVGLVPLITALVSWCPLYTLLGLKTCKK